MKRKDYSVKKRKEDQMNKRLEEIMGRKRLMDERG